MKVFISTTTFGSSGRKPLAILGKKGIRYSLNPYKRRLEKDEITSVLKRGYDGLIAGTEPLTASVLRAAAGLKVISRVGAGLDNIDMEAAVELDIGVFNTPDILTDAVAEFTMGLILSCLRKIPLMDRDMRSGIWNKRMGAMLKGRLLGIIGFGRIGRRVACLAKAFGAGIIFHDTGNVRPGDNKKVSLKRLLRDSDIISIHASSGRTEIAAKEISMMKKGAVLINTSRGGFVDEEALYRGLKTGRVGSAGLDVFVQEPYRGRLSGLDNVILTPHAGSYAAEARTAMEEAAARNLIKGFERKGLL